MTKAEQDLEEEMVEFLDESHSELTEKQKKLPPEIQKSILKKKGKTTSDKKEEKDENKEKSEAKKGLWENIRDKKKRMGKNYKPAKPGDKDYPDPKALKKAQESSKKKKESKGNDEAGYPPKCKEGYEEKDGKCVPMSESSWKKKKKK